MFIKRYHAASKIYIDEHKPQFRADVVINNNNLNDPNFS
jgi:uridine kinase